MAFIIYELSKKDAVKYKDYYYQKSNDRYYIFNSEGTKLGMRFSVKACKDHINNYYK